MTITRAVLVFGLCLLLQVHDAKGSDLCAPENENSNIHTKVCPLFETQTACEKFSGCFWNVTYAPTDAEICSQYPLHVDAGQDVSVTFDPDHKGRSEWAFLNGGNSYGPTGTVVSYEWSFLYVPDKSSLDSHSIRRKRTRRPAFEPDADGVYKLQLEMWTNQVARENCSATATVKVTAVCNTDAPAVIVPSVKEAFIGVEFEISASATDAENDALTYAWTLVSAPSESETTSGSITGADALAATFIPDKVGSYSFTFTASDHCSSGHGLLHVAVQPLCELDLTANITSSEKATQAATCEEQVTESRCTGGDKSCVWFGTNNTRVAPEVKCLDNNAPPATAFSIGTEGDEFIAGHQIHLNGGQTRDPEHDSVTYSWGFTYAPGRSPPALGDSTAVRTTFTPEDAGAYNITLTATDECHGATTVEQQITVVSQHEVRCRTRTDPAVVVSADTFVLVGSTAYLNASGSTDPDGVDTLAFRWEVTEYPSGGHFFMGVDSNGDAHARLDTSGNYTFKVTVSNACSSVSQNVQVSAKTEKEIKCEIDEPPVIVLEVNFPSPYYVGENIEISAAGTTDADTAHDQLQFDFHFDHTAIGSHTGIENATHSVASFVPDSHGTYIVTAVVDDGCRSTNESLSFSVYTVEEIACQNNTAPTAAISTTSTTGAFFLDSNWYAMVGTAFTLDGTASTDTDNDTITYHWAVTSTVGEKVSLSGEETSQVTITPSSTGNLTVTLTVKDGCVRSTLAQATLDIIVGTEYTVTCFENTATSLSLEGSGNAQVGSTVTVAAQASDAETASGRQTLVYGWEFLTREPGTIVDSYNINSDKIDLTLKATGVVGVGVSVVDGCDTVWNDYWFEVVETKDCSVNNTLPTLTLTPLADNNNLTTMSGSEYLLSGSEYTQQITVTDGESDAYVVTYGTYNKASYRNGVFDSVTHNTTDHSLVFIPGAESNYSVNVVVSDGCGFTAGTMSFSAILPKTYRCRDNVDPVVSVEVSGNITTVDGVSNAIVGELVTLTTSASDANGDSLTYAWETSATIGDSAAANTTLTTSSEGEVSVLLLVDDTCVQQNVWSFTYNVVSQAKYDCLNIDFRPTASAAAVADSYIGQSVNLTADTASNVADSGVKYKWAISSGSGSIADSSASDTTLQISASGSFSVKLTVTDSCGNTNTSEVTFTAYSDATSLACAEADSQVPTAVLTISDSSPTVFDTIVLDGASTTDRDTATDALTFTWVLEQKPRGSAQSLVEVSGAYRNLTVDTAGIYKILLTVSDGCSSSSEEKSVIASDALRRIDETERTVYEDVDEPAPTQVSKIATNAPTAPQIVESDVTPDVEEKEEEKESPVVVESPQEANPVETTTPTATETTAVAEAKAATDSNEESSVAEDEPKKEHHKKHKNHNHKKHKKHKHKKH